MSHREMENTGDY